MKDSNHIIEKVFLEVNTSNTETAYSIKNNISQFLESEVFPQIEKFFDEFDESETIYRFDKLDISVSVNDWKNLDEISSEIGIKIQKELDAYDLSTIAEQKLRSKKSNLRKLSPEKNNESSFFYFIESGQLPWYGKEQDFIDFTSPENWVERLIDPVFIDTLKKILLQNSQSVDRLIYQLSEEAVISFLIKIQPFLKEFEYRILSLTKVLDRTLKYHFLKLLIQIFNSTQTIRVAGKVVSFLRKIIQNYSPENKVVSKISIEIFEVLRKILSPTLRSELQKNGIVEFFSAAKIDSKNYQSVFLEIENSKLQTTTDIQPPVEQILADSTEKDHGIAIQNAGLILLHPFFKHLFHLTKITNSEGIIEKQNMDLAVQTLHFVATGAENVFEGNLVFEKFLCGIPLKMPIQKQSLLTEEIRDEVQTLLKEAVRNWLALGNTSPDGLRENFIHRDGKLFQKEGKAKIIVERKVQDILLEKLSWNISMFKLPWRKELITVEW